VWRRCVNDRHFYNAEMNILKRRRILKAVNSLDLIPVRIYGHDEVEGRVVILVPKFESKWIHLFFPRTQMLFYRIKLDESGTSVWNNIDGEKTTLEIAKIALTQFNDSNLTIAEFQERVSKFMSILYDRRYISFRQLLDE
jgi:hypothetical protein